MGNLLRDLRFAFRQLGNAPSFAVTAVLTLALGIGANTAIFSLVNSLLLKPLPAAHPEQLSALALGQNNGPKLPFFSWQEYKAIRAGSQHAFSDVFMSGLSLDGFASSGQAPQRIMTTFVTGNFFQGLGLQPAAGRLLLATEGEVLGSDPVIVLDYDFWTTHFNGDASVVGRQVTVNGHPLTVVGVAPRGFHGTQNFVTPAVYLPLSQMTVEGVTQDVVNNWQMRRFNAFGRLRPGVDLNSATAELSVAAKEMTRLQPEDEKGAQLGAFSEPSMRIPTGDPNAMFLIGGLFLALAGMVLLLACVNVANLVMVRATAREREMAIRTAMGAKRSRLIAQMVTESVTLALLGGGMGVVLGVWATSLLGQMDIHADLPVRFVFDFDWRIFLYALGSAVVGGILVGLVPAVKIARSNLNTVLHEGGRGVTGGRQWLRNGLVAMQIAVSLVLLVIAGLFVRSLTAMQTMDFGFNPDHVLNLVLDPGEIGRNDAQSRELAAKIETSLGSIAGVKSVSHANSVPLGYFNNGGDNLIIDGMPAPADPNTFGAGENIVTPDYFRTMGIELERGRVFTTADNEQGRDVAVIGESTAKKYWPGLDPIGRTFRLSQEKNRKLEVVGIARDAEFQLFGGGKTRPFVYLPFAQHYKGNSLMVFHLKTEQEPLLLATTAEKAIHGLEPQLPVFQVQSMRQALYSMNGLMLFQIGATLAAIMGGLGLTLAVIGLYGVVSYAVSRRVHEIGLRMALGASRGTVFRMIYRQSVVVVGVGLTVGLALALLAAKAASGFVVVSVWDPATYGVVAVVLATAALGSCYLPARRAMQVEPMVALRED
jgi:predicted permease